jgi:DnaJ-class molecular chaperone
MGFVACAECGGRGDLSYGPCADCGGAGYFIAPPADTDIESEC